jgi:tyrosine-protein phosphatase YwqE
MKTARRLVLDGLVHAAASDAHSPEDQGSVASGMAWIRKQRGAAVLDKLLDENPRRILSGELPEPPAA